MGAVSEYPGGGCRLKVPLYTDIIAQEWPILRGRHPKRAMRGAKASGELFSSGGGYNMISTQKTLIFDHKAAFRNICIASSGGLRAVGEGPPRAS